MRWKNEVFRLICRDRWFQTRHGRRGTVLGTDGISSALTATDYKLPKQIAVHQVGNMRIRKITPLEAWRLQGFPDWAFDKAKEAGLSNSQLYKQAGNYVTVSVIYEIAKRMNWEED